MSLKTDMIHLFIEQSYLHRKVYRGLLALPKDTVSKLSRSVAIYPSRILKTNEQKQTFFHIAKTDELAQSISRWTADKEDKILNRFQKEAMFKALKGHFQLIQGPPGGCNDVLLC